MYFCFLIPSTQHCGLLSSHGVKIFFIWLYHNLFNKSIVEYLGCSAFFNIKSKAAMTIFVHKYICAASVLSLAYFLGVKLQVQQENNNLYTSHMNIYLPSHQWKVTVPTLTTPLPIIEYIITFIFANFIGKKWNLF